MSRFIFKKVKVSVKHFCDTIRRDRRKARSANAECKMQNAKLGDGANEAQTVGVRREAPMQNAECKMQN